MNFDDLKSSARGVISIPEAGEVFEMKRSAAYAAAKRGEIPTLQLGRRRVVPVPALLRMLEGQSEVDGGVDGAFPS